MNKRLLLGKNDQLNMSSTSLLVMAKKQENDIKNMKAVYEKERECLELLYDSRKLLSYLIRMREEKNRKEREEKERKRQEEAKKKGNLTVTEIQGILQQSSEQDETDWVTEIQNLKKELQIEVRQNHVLERELAKLDKRIGLLIKNRGQMKIDEKKDKKSKKKKGIEEKVVPDFSQSPKMIELYQDLFYLLQTETRYMANVIYLVQAQDEDVTQFLYTVIVTLYGDAFSPREEFLCLKLFQNAIQIELQNITKVKAFITGETVVPKMCMTYCKRKQGVEYLRTSIEPVVRKIMQKKELDLEINPVAIYQKMITDQEIKTGKTSDLPKNVSEEEALKQKFVEETLNKNLEELKSLCKMFLEAIISTIDTLPYGLRWICKALKDLCFERFPQSEEDIWRLVGYFVYYRFLNIAIVSPDTFKLVDPRDMGVSVIKGLIQVANVLQTLFNLIEYDGKEKPYMLRLNGFIKENLPSVQNYLKQVCQVDEPEEKLQVNQYNELVQKARPSILIGTHEICNIHTIMLKFLDRVAPDQNDPVRVILKDLAEAPPKPKENKDIQLWLTNRFNINIDEESETTKLYNQTKELILPVLRTVPIESSIQKLNLMDVLENGIKHAAETKNKQLSTQINTILENIQKLEKEAIVSKSDNYESLLRDIALEVANRRVIRENQRREISRLTQALAKLRTHQNYLKEQKKDYNSYLQGARKSVYTQTKKGKKKKKTEGTMSFKFSYKELAKRGVIVDSEVPEFSRKTCSLTISSSEHGVFEIVAKVAGIQVEEMTLELDELLEKRYNNIETYELDQVTLGVNMTIWLINQYFLLGKKK